MINGPFSIAMLNHRTHISGTPSLGVPLQSWGSSIQTSGWNPMVAMVAPASTIWFPQVSSLWSLIAQQRDQHTAVELLQKLQALNVGSLDFL